MRWIVVREMVVCWVEGFDEVWCRDQALLGYIMTICIKPVLMNYR